MLLLIAAAFAMIAAASATAAGREGADDSSGDLQEMSRGGWKKKNGYSSYTKYGSHNKKYGSHHKKYGYGSSYYKKPVKKYDEKCVNPTFLYPNGAVEYSASCKHDKCCRGYVCSDSTPGSMVTVEYKPAAVTTGGSYFEECTANETFVTGGPDHRCCYPTPINEGGDVARTEITSVICGGESCTDDNVKIANANPGTGSAHNWLKTNNNPATKAALEQIACFCCSGVAQFKNDNTIVCRDDFNVLSDRQYQCPLY